MVDFTILFLVKPAEGAESEVYTKAGREEGKHDKDSRVHHDGASVRESI